MYEQLSTGIFKTLYIIKHEYALMLTHKQNLCNKEFINKQNF